MRKQAGDGQKWAGNCGNKEDRPCMQKIGQEIITAVYLYNRIVTTLGIQLEY